MAGGSGVVVVVVAVMGGGCGCLSALLGSGAATVLLTLVMMIYDRSSPGQPRLNSTEPPEPILDRSNGRPGSRFLGLAVLLDEMQTNLFLSYLGLFCPQMARRCLSGASSEISRPGLTPRIRIDGGDGGIEGDPGEMMRSYSVCM